MKLASIQFPAFKPYGKSAIELYISGCTNNCKGCCNPELQSYDLGKTIEFKDLIIKLAQREPLFDVISFAGGDLMCQDKHDIVQLLFTLRTHYPQKEFWLLTGKEFDQIDSYIKGFFDYIKAGKFDVDLYRENVFPASSNQKVWKQIFTNGKRTWQDCTNEYRTKEIYEKGKK